MAARRNRAPGAHSRAIPRISTRGMYDLRTGRPLQDGARYVLWPASKFAAIGDGPGEIAIVVHGMRNDRAGAAQKFAIAKRRLRALGYRHPIVGYSYDADVRGAHVAATEAAALRTAEAIARRNGAHLAAFVADHLAAHPRVRIRLIGHSLGSIVIDSALRRLAARGDCAGAVESVHLFGASLDAARASSAPSRRAVRRVVRRRVTNCYCPTDEVLRHSADAGEISHPIGLEGIPTRARPARYVQRRLAPRNHRFASYVAALRSFP